VDKPFERVPSEPVPVAVDAAEMLPDTHAGFAAPLRPYAWTGDQSRDLREILRRWGASYEFRDWNHWRMEAVSRYRGAVTPGSVEAPIVAVLAAYGSPAVSEVWHAGWRRVMELAGAGSASDAG
jgi:hypothetical protein